MNEKRILFTGAGRRVELIQAFRQASLTTGIPLLIYGADMSDTAPALAFCDRARIVRPIKDPAYLDDLLSICVTDAIDLLIPTIDTDLLMLSENKERFEENRTRVLISAPDKIRLCRDKNLTGAFFRECALKAPETTNDVAQYAGGFPAFIKPKDGSSSIDAHRAETKEALLHYAGMVEDYVIQPCIEGEEYTIDICCDFDGRALSIAPRKRLQVRAGEVLKTEICMDETIIEEARAIVERFRPCGPLTVQLIREHTTGDDYFIEINPRFGGGAPLSIRAGADSASAILKALAGEAVTGTARVEDGAVYNRFDQCVRVASGARLLPVKGVIFDLDDTLYPEKDYVKSGFAAVAAHLGDEAYAGALWALFLKGRPAIDDLLSDIGRPEEKDACLRVYRTHAPQIALTDEVKELLYALRKKEIRVGVVTDGRPEGQQAKIDALGLNDFTDDIVITDALGGAQFRKPCDIAFRILQQRWRVPAAQIVYVGDNAGKDFLAPLQLGMRGVLYRNPDGLYTDHENEADNRDVAVIERLPQLLDLIDGRRV